MLTKVAREFAYERARSFGGSTFGNFVRHDIALEAKKNLIFLPYELKVKSSVGQGNWAAVPWLGFFDPLITESATRGFYVVYLVNPQTEEIFLSLNQGATEVYREFGESKGREVLARRAIDMADRVPSFARLFDRSSIILGSNETLPAGYMAGHSFGRKYVAGQINKDAFFQDLTQMLAAYEELINKGGTTPTDVMIESSGSNNVEETRRYVLSKRIERSRKVRVAVLARRGPYCEGCGLDPELHYSYAGPKKNTPLEVHHIKPISGLAEGESRRYKIPDDFLVLCPTCHSMIHKQIDAGNIELLRSRICFRHTHLL